MQSNPSPRILIVNPYGIGDSLFMTPVLRTLKEKWPKSYLGLLLGSRTESIFKFNPHVNQVYVYNKDFLKTLSLGVALYERSLLYLKIKKQNFDILVDVSNTDEYSFLAKFIWHIPIRIGFRYKNRGRFLTHTISIPTGFSKKHVADYYNDLLTFLNIDPRQIAKKLDFFGADLEKSWLDTLFIKHGISKSDKIIAILPGGGASWGAQAKLRYWPTHSFAMLANELVKKYHAKIFLIGSSSEKNLCDIVKSHMTTNAISLAGETTLTQLACLMMQSHLVIGTESGPLHLAGALDRPSLVIYGPVDDVVYGPYSSTQNQIVISNSIACRPCYKNFRALHCENRLCLNELDHTHIFKKACEILGPPLNHNHA